MQTRTFIDPAQLSRQESYKLLIGSVVPRPIAWTSTVSPDGERNLAPFSFFTAVSVEPPMLLISVERSETGVRYKDTIANILATGAFCVNVVSRELAAAMQATSGEFPREVDEFAVAKVTPVDCDRIPPPRVAEAKIAMECELEQTLAPGSDDLVIGRVIGFHLDESIVEEGRIDQSLLRPVGRLAGTFGTTDRLFRL